MLVYLTRRRRLLCLTLVLPSMMLVMSRNYRQRTSATSNLPLDSSFNYDDPKLLEAVTRRFLHPPSTKPYNLMQDMAKTNMQAAQYVNYIGEFAYIFCQRAIEAIFEGVKSGFFVEAGALDGEFLSNTLPLERDKGWTGLLVEADGDMFQELLSKNRRVWSSHSCLATRKHPHTETLIKYVRQNDLTNAFSNHAARAHGSLLGQTGGATLDHSMPGHPIYEPVQCLPLASLLLAINVTHVDLVSLDVEGAEVGILRYFPWRRVTVDVWVVEHAQKTSPGDLVSSNASLAVDTFTNLFTSQGYEVYESSKDLFIPNYVFVRRDSSPYHRLRAQGKL